MTMQWHPFSAEYTKNINTVATTTECTEMDTTTDGDVEQVKQTFRNVEKVSRTVTPVATVAG